MGGIIAGQDLIKSAETRAQISQIEKYNSAVNTFKSKFNSIPGDMPLSTASSSGFVLGTGCDGTYGRRDGNGLLDGTNAVTPFAQASGEVELFWQDISSSSAGNLIDTNIPNGGIVDIRCGGVGGLTLTTAPGTTYIGDYFPLAKIGYGNFVYVYTIGGFNWYGIAALNGSVGIVLLNTSATVPVLESYKIDSKIDDGIPLSGSVQATYISGSDTSLATAPHAATDSTTTCYNTMANTYSLSSFADYGSHGNCALSFRMQGAGR